MMVRAERRAGMDCKGFVIAMRAQVAPLSADHPHKPRGAVAPGWLIVCRWGVAGEYLTISSTMGEPKAAGDGAEVQRAPAGLHPRRTWFGVLTPDQEGPQSVFLLTRDLPRDMTIAGDFASAEGYARLVAEEDGVLRLVAVVREVAAGGPTACYLVADRRPWRGEVLDRLPT